MMAIIVHERDAPGLCRDLADEFEPAPDALEAGERPLDRAILDLEFGGDRDRGEGVPTLCSPGIFSATASGGRPARIA
jgi:hypothetical protein